MKKAIFYISSFILTVAIAISARAVAFSTVSEESGSIPINNVVYSDIKHVEKKETGTIANDFALAKAVNQNENNQSAKQENIIAQPVVQKPEIPTFHVTDYISSCDSVNCFTSKDAERGVVQYQDTFFYGHSTIAFDRLKTVYVGQEIKLIDINGRAHTYQIAQRIVKEKSYLNSTGKIDGFTAGVYSANYYGTQYSASFMTCGNGANNDSNYRLILFAVEI